MWALWKAVLCLLPVEREKGRYSPSCSSLDICSWCEAPPISPCALSLQGGRWMWKDSERVFLTQDWKSRVRCQMKSVSSNVCSSLFVVLHACLHILTHFLSLFPNYCIWTVLEIVNFLGYPLDHRKWKEDHDRTWSNCGDSKFLTGWSNWQDLEPYMWRWTIQPVLQRRLRFTVTGDIYLFKVHKEWVSLVVQSVKNLPAM